MFDLINVFEVLARVRARHRRAGSCVLRVDVSSCPRACALVHPRT